MQKRQATVSFLKAQEAGENGNSQTAPGEGAPPTRLSSRLGKVWWRCGSQLRTSLIPFNLHEALRV